MTKKLENIVDYIIRFLLREENSHLANKVGYTSHREDFIRYRVVIKPSDFFEEKTYGTVASIPTLPLKNFNDIPLLFGRPWIEKGVNQLIVDADIIASTYFLISRYEEMVRADVRDQHGRFPGIESLPYKAGFIHRPLVDVYGKLLRKWLRDCGEEVVEPKENINRIYLTHDVDKLAHYRNVRSLLGAVLRAPKSPKNTFIALKTYFGKIESDPWFTFPWLLELNAQLRENLKKSDVRQIVFIKSGGGEKAEDLPLQDITSKDYLKLFKLCHLNRVKIGLHPSYEAGINGKLISEEKALLESVFGEKTHLVRHHYLTSREPRDLYYLIKNDFTDDFTMGYADVSGFRLGTCRAVKWIDPFTQELTDFTLHPLTVMDNTLHEKKYMNLQYDDAKKYCFQLFRQVKKYNGELVLLWHNTSVEENNMQYHRLLYKWLVRFLQKDNA